jgi:hypothetical protein
MLIASTERLTLDVIRRDDIRRTVATARAARWLELGATGNIRLSICRLMHHRIRGDWLARKACHWPSRFAECASTNLNDSSSQNRQLCFASDRICFSWR